MKGPTLFVRTSDRDSVPVVMRLRTFIGWSLLSCLLACPNDPPECYTTQDCFDEGRTLTECVDGQCLRACVQDVDCQYSATACAQDDEACKAQVTQLQSKQSVCEDFLCIPACPDVACPEGAECTEGRCTFFYEGFEAEKPGDFVTLEALGWNAIEWPLTNPHLLVAWSGDSGCAADSDRDRCAGPSSDGQYFAVVQRSQATARAQRKLGTTCRDCACCLACRDPLSRTSSTSVCPGLIYPEINECSADVHPQCQSICDSCAQCPDEAAGVVVESDLNACELQIAPRACEACLVYDQCLETKEAENRPCPGDAMTYPECAGEDMSAWTQADCTRCLVKECASLEDDCHNCRKAASLKVAHPDEPERWQPIQDRCTALGAQACYELPKATIRSDLTDEEQALESPEIDLTKASGRTVLQFDFIAFNLQERYIRVVQGDDEVSWPSEAQRVSVQFCKSDCQNPSAWAEAQFDVSKAAATFPGPQERKNGLLYTEQNPVDWKISTRSVLIPEASRTKTFRFRFVPFLDRDARVGIDNIRIRSFEQ